MGFKITLIVALCIAKGFAMKPLVKVPEKGPCKKPISESAEEIPHEFEEAMHEMDEVRETVSTAAMDAYFKGNDPEVIIACFREQKGNYQRLGKEISQKIRKGAAEIAEELGDDYEKYGKRAEGPLKTIGFTMKTLPVKMWLHIKNKEFGKALEEMRESRRVVEENSKILNELINEMAKEHPESAKRAEDLAHEIRTASRNGCKTIGEAFHKCVQEGGPKNPKDDAELDAEEENVSEQ